MKIHPWIKAVTCGQFYSETKMDKYLPGHPLSLHDRERTLFP